MAASIPSSNCKVYEILHKLYSSVCTLKQWVASVDGDYNTNLMPCLLSQMESSKSFHDLVSQTFVAVPYDAKPLPPSFSTAQTCHQQDLIGRNIQKLCQLNQSYKNVFSCGFYQMTTKPTALVSSQCHFECKFPNQMYGLLLYDNWEVLLSIIGDELMDYLLMVASLFIRIGSSNYTQITGLPVFELVPTQQDVRPIGVILSRRTNNQTSVHGEGVHSAVRYHGRSSRISEVSENCLPYVDRHDNNSFDQERNINESAKYGKRKRRGGKNRWRKKRKQEWSESFLASLISGGDAGKLFLRIFSQNVTKCEFNTQLILQSIISKHHMQKGSSCNETAILVDKCDISHKCDNSDNGNTGEGDNNFSDRDTCDSDKCVKKLGTESKNFPREFHNRNVCLANATANHTTQTDNNGMLLDRGDVAPSASDNLSEKDDEMKTDEVISDSSTSISECDGLAKAYESVYQHLEPWLQKFIDSNRKCPYRALLNHQCPTTTGPRPPTTPTPQGSSVIVSRAVPIFCRFSKSKWSSTAADIIWKAQKRLQRKQPPPLDNSVPIKQVYLFLRCVSYKVIPAEFFGSKRNWSKWQKVLHRILERGKFDKIRIGQLLEGFKVHDCKWMEGVSNDPMKRILMAQLLFWLVTEYVFVILKSFFYVTDGCSGRNKLFYHRRSVWAQLERRARTDYMDCGLFTPLSLAQVKASLHLGQSMGASLLRFMPKANAFRPIVNMQRNIMIPGTKGVGPINKQLLDLFNVLKYIAEKSPELVGCSVFGTDDVFRLWKKMCDTLRANSEHRSLYFVKADIRGCYDNIIQQKLYDIIVDILNQGPQKYVTQRHVSVYLAGRVVKRSFKKVIRPSHSRIYNFVQFIKTLEKSGLSNSTIFVDKVTQTTVTVEDLIKKLHAHLFHNIVKLNASYYRQHQGISQGSVLSTLLCNFYFAHMERHSLGVVVDDDELLMRMVDDYLYVTPHRHKAQNFIDILSQGIPEYNCFVNERKFLVNFPCVTSTGLTPLQTAANTLFPWCGMLFDPVSLDVSLDYGAYSHNSISETITFDLGHKPGTGLKTKLLSTLQPKCHPLFLHANINSWNTLIGNIVRLFLMSAYRFHSYCLQLPTDRRPQQNPAFFLRVIKAVQNSLPAYAEQKMRKLQLTDYKLSVPVSVVQWLCYKAFLLKLEQHSSLYHKLIRVIRSELRRISHSIGHSEIDKMQAHVELPAEFSTMLP